jgi:hypothetical protein
MLSEHQQRKENQMISDTLSESAEEIRWYLNKMPEAYAPVKPRIERLLTEMDNLRRHLDMPPETNR